MMLSARLCLLNPMCFQTWTTRRLPSLIPTRVKQKHARILDGKSKNHSHSEELRYDSVVAVSPGIYEVEISGQDGETKAQQQLVALSHESYVVLRTGLEAQAGTSFPQDIVIFPASDAGKLKSHAGSLGAPLTTIISLFVMLLLSI